MFTSIYSDDLKATKQFYEELLGLQVNFDSDWIVQLSSPDNEALKLTIQLRDHELVPQRFQKKPQGFSIAFVVKNCDAIFEKASAMNLEIIQEPKNEEYGQRRFLTVDPNGMLLDVSSNCEPSPEFVQQYMS